MRGHHSRRDALLAGAALAMAACTKKSGGTPVQNRLSRLSGVLPQPSASLPSGLHSLAVPGSRPSLLYIPAVANSEAGFPLLVSLHGAGGEADHGIRILRNHADKYGFALLAPASRADTWDMIAGGYGPDVETLDHCLSYTFSKLKIRTGQVAISGFSDGASYALSMGVSNGELFSAIIAFSPGFMGPTQPQGKPRIFISHGIRDKVLPIERCGRPLAQALRRSSYSVEYREFDGPHVVPDAIKDEAMLWWNRSSSPTGAG